MRVKTKRKPFATSSLPSSPDALLGVRSGVEATNHARYNSDSSFFAWMAISGSVCSVASSSCAPAQEPMDFSLR